MTTNLALASITSTGSTTTRTFGDRFADIINVKDYGAKGDGTTNDTTAIQNAFNAAFNGSWPSANLISGASSNKPVFFPAGTYIVNPPASALTITSAVQGASNGAGGFYIKLGFSANHNLNVADSIYIQGAVCSSDNPINGPQWVQAVNDATHVSVLSLWSGTYTSGGTACVPCLRLKGIDGSMIFGEGRDSTTIKGNTANCTTLHTNGFRYNVIKDIAISGTTGGLALDINWDGIVNCSTQGNLLEYLQIGAGNVGLAIGYNGAMSSETTLLHCQIGGCTTGIYLGNFNATNNCMFGGQIQACTTGILANDGGDISTLHGVSFENTGGGQLWDIKINNSAHNGWSISCCRSESQSFLSCGPEVPIHLDCCSQMGGTGSFFDGSGYVTMTGCYSPNGNLGPNTDCYLTLVNCNFGSSTFLAAATNLRSLAVGPRQTLTIQTGSSYSFKGYDVGTKVQGNRSTAQTFTVLSFSSDGYNYGSKIGNRITVEQIGTGQITIAPSTGTTIHSANGLKTRAQYSVIYLDSEGSDVWTLSGDSST